MDAFPRHQLLLQEDTHTPPSLRTHQCSCLEEWLVCRKRDRKSTRLNSSHLVISYAVFCLKKKNTINIYQIHTPHYRPFQNTLNHTTSISISPPKFVSLSVLL